ncbi:ocs element-binding factor 1-like [Dorcoceras hygrometricum]|uniref:Ocs element-binding factor 1-like n=1 Tax=Dorcoceras hygrometricum TaxID=472368 RepID=A0A2Z7AN03_9LAMI|nr:ocs element-binding factor 1-like [Dorcoceras hygrometricum]
MNNLPYENPPLHSHLIINLDQMNSRSFLDLNNAFNFPNHQTSLPMEEFVAPNSLCMSSNSTSDEAEDQYQRGNIIDERKKRRMISNRESARRSRMRKQRHLDELRSHVLSLRTEHHNLIDKLNLLSESHDKILHENARLKEEASDLREMVTELLISNSYDMFRDLDQEDASSNAARIRPGYTNQSVTA